MGVCCSGTALLITRVLVFFPLAACVTVDCRLTESVRYCTDVVNLVVPPYLISVRVLTTLFDLIVVPLSVEAHWF